MDTGRRESERPVSPRLGKDELKNMAKKDRPRSYESDSYRQWRILCSGIIPVNEKDVTVALAIYMSELELISEALGNSGSVGALNVITSQA